MKKITIRAYETYEHNGKDYTAIPNTTGECTGCSFRNGIACEAPDGLDCKGIKFIEQPRFDNSDYEFVNRGGCFKTFAISMVICVAFWGFVIWAISSAWNAIF